MDRERFTGTNTVNLSDNTWQTCWKTVGKERQEQVGFVGAGGRGGHILIHDRGTPAVCAGRTGPGCLTMSARSSSLSAWQMCSRRRSPCDSALLLFLRRLKARTAGRGRPPLKPLTLWSRFPRILWFGAYGTMQNADIWSSADLVSLSRSGEAAFFLYLQ